MCCKATIWSDHTARGIQLNIENKKCEGQNFYKIEQTNYLTDRKINYNLRNFTNKSNKEMSPLI